MDENPFDLNIDSEDVFLPLQELSNRNDSITANNEGTVAAFASWFATGPLKRARYKDFSSIDWLFDNYKDRERNYLLKKTTNSILDKLKAAYEISQTWIVLLAVGVSIGVLSTFISVSTQWMIDLKDGYCSTGFYLNQKFCCWMTEDFCENWVTWSELFGVNWAFGENIVQFIASIVDSTIFASLATFLVTFYAPYAAGQGIAELKTIMSGFLIQEFLSVKTMLIKCISVILAVASGLNVGKEVSLVHISACCTNIFSNLFPSIANSEAQKRKLFSAASAAGFSVAFGAPIAGVLFSLESISYYYTLATMWKSFFCAAVAAITLKYLDPFRNGKLVPFQNVYERTWHPFELIFFVCIGIVGGIVGAIIVKLNSFFFSYRLRSRINKYARGEVVIVTLVTAVVCYANIFTRSDSVTLVSNLFTECRTKDSTGLCDSSKSGINISSLLVAFCIRTILTSISSEIAVPTGIFLPSMAVGASFGRAVGMLVQSLHRSHPDWPLFSSCLDDVKCVTPAVYALVGSAAVLSSTTGMRVSVVVVMFELTGALVYVLPLMIAVTVSTWVAKLISPRNIFESVIRLHEYPYLEKERDYNVTGTARGLMTPVHDVVFINSRNQTLQSLQSLLYHTPSNFKNTNNSSSELRHRRNSASDYTTIQYQGFPVVLSTDSMFILGYISNNDLRLGLETALSSSSFSPTTQCYFGSASEFYDNSSTSGANNSLDYRRSISSSAYSLHPTTSSPPTHNIPEYFDFEEFDSVYIDLRPYMDHSPITVFPETPIDLVIEIFRQLGIRQVLVAKNRVLYGIITKKDILKCVNELDKSTPISLLRNIFPSLGRN